MFAINEIIFYYKQNSYFPVEPTKMSSAMGLQKIIETCGSKAELARQVGVEPMTVTHWTQRGLPAKWAIELSERFKVDLKELVNVANQPNP